MLTSAPYARIHADEHLPYVVIQPANDEEANEDDGTTIPPPTEAEDVLLQLGERVMQVRAAGVKVSDWTAAFVKTPGTVKPLWL